MQCCWPAVLLLRTRPTSVHSPRAHTHLTPGPKVPSCNPVCQHSQCFGLSCLWLAVPSPVHHSNSPCCCANSWAYYSPCVCGVSEGVRGDCESVWHSIQRTGLQGLCTVASRSILLVPFTGWGAFCPAGTRLFCRARTVRHMAMHHGKAVLAHGGYRCV